MSVNGQQAAPDLLLVIDLTTARSQSMIVAPGIVVKQVYIASAPAGANFNVRFGAFNPAIPMIAQASRIFARGMQDGIYIDNTAQPGLTVQVAIVQGAKS